MKRKCVVVGIILLFVGTCIIPAIAQDTEKPLSTSRGNWLYVGGSGPGNYSKIQDAVKDAYMGDIVYVFNESSPYYENIFISKSITLIGEQKTSTVIQGEVEIATHGVTLTGFTIKDAGGFGVWIPGLNGTGIEGSPNIIDGNIMWNVSAGVTVLAAGKTVGYFIVTNNIICAHEIGIEVTGKNNTVFGNTISFMNDSTFNVGISTLGDFNNISYNTVSGADLAIYIPMSLKTMIYRNNITDNPGYGVYLLKSPGGNIILQNNFMRNGENAFIDFCLVNALHNTYHNDWGQEHPIISNVFDGNYWDKPRSEPYPIDGFFYVHGILLYLLRFLRINLFDYKNFQRFDMHPAQEPYDIPGMR
jgi:parallel beta-helix repeat protein